MNRKDFFKKACFTGICMCGFSAIAMPDNNENSGQDEETKERNQILIRTWIKSLMMK